jgi:hypothetical protein
MGDGNIKKLKSKTKKPQILFQTVAFCLLEPIDYSSLSFLKMMTDDFGFFHKNYIFTNIRR